MRTNENQFTDTGLVKKAVFTLECVLFSTHKNAGDLRIAPGLEAS